MPKTNLAPASHLHDDAEITKFNALAQEWWNPQGAMKPLHQLNPVRLGFIRRELLAHFSRDPQKISPFTGLFALDIGCAAGLVAEPLSRMGFNVTGIDLAEENIRMAKAHAAAGGLTITYQATPLEQLPDAPTYDVITLLEVVEHVPDVGGLIREAAKRLKTGGILITSTLNRTLKAYALAIIGAEYVLRWLPRGTHDWEKFVTPDEMEGYFEAAGLIPAMQEGIVFNPLTKSWSLNADCDVNYLITARKAA